MGIGGRHVSTIILYGSFSHGDFHEGSDVDLIIVGDVHERFHKAGRRPSSISRVEPICYTEEEFAELVRSPSPFIHPALAEGVRV